MTKKTRLTTAKKSTSSKTPPTQEKKKKPSEKKASGESATQSSAPLPENFLSDALELAAKSTHRGVREPPPPPDPTPPQSPVSAIGRDNEGNLSGVELTLPIDDKSKWPTMENIDPRWFGSEGPQEKITTRPAEEIEEENEDVWYPIMEGGTSISEPTERPFHPDYSSSSDSDEEAEDELHEEDQEEGEESQKQATIRRMREEAQDAKRKKATRKAYAGWTRISSSLLEQSLLTLSATNSSSTRHNWFSTRRPDFPRLHPELEDVRGMMVEVDQNEDELHLFDPETRRSDDNATDILADIYDGFYNQWRFAEGMGSGEDKRKAHASFIRFGKFLFRSYYDQPTVAKNTLLKTENFKRTSNLDIDAMKRGLMSWTVELTHRRDARLTRHSFGRTAVDRTRFDDLMHDPVADRTQATQPYSFSSARKTPNAKETERERKRAEEMERNRAREDRRHANERSFWQGDRRYDSTRGRSREQPRDRSREQHRDRSRERHRSRSRDGAPTRDQSWGWPDRHSDSGSGRGERVREGRRERSRSRETITGDSAPHSPDTSSPPRRRSRANNYDSEGQRSSTLVTAIKLPTSNKIITPGVGTGWNETIEYLQSCLTQ